MPTHFKCSIPDCKSGGPKDDRKGVTIYSFPTDEALFQKWIVQIKENVDPTFSYKPTSRECGLHFRGGRKLGGNNIPTVFNQNRNIIRDIGDDCDTEKNFLKMTVPSNFIQASQITHRLSLSSTLLKLRMDIS